MNNDYILKRLEEFDEDIKPMIENEVFYRYANLGLAQNSANVLNNQIKSFLSISIHQAEQEMLKRVVEHIKKYNPKSLDTGVAGKIEEGILQRAKDDILASLAKPLPTNPKGE